MSTESSRPGIYNVEYFSGAQTAIYIGDVWVDEITSISFQVSQHRRPLYGYASELFDDVAEGTVLVSGNFTINFKEAGYLWLVLNRYKELKGQPDAIYKQMRRDISIDDAGFRGKFDSPFSSDNRDQINRQNIEQIMNGEISTFERNRALAKLAAHVESPTALDLKTMREERNRNSASLGGFASESRRSAERTDGGRVGSTESIFETFENQVWRKSSGELDQQHRRCDDPFLNPFDIYLTFGDFSGSDYDNHTIQRLRDVYIVGTSKQVVIDGQPVQEAYSFIARNLV